MPAAALIAVALAGAAAAAASPPVPAPGPRPPCAAEPDAGGRTFRTCFDPGNGLDLSAGGAWGRDEPALGGATDLGVRLRWRRDLRTGSGELEWLRDMTFLDARVRLTAREEGVRAASALAWRGVFVRHRASPFLLVPGPRLRLPFPFDVGAQVEAGGASWDAARPREVVLAPIRAALLLDVGGHGALRRLALGPEVAWTVRAGGAETVHAIAPFTSGVIDLRAESPGGLSAADLTLRGGSSLQVPGGAAGFLEARVAVERIVAAVNDRPVALYAEGALRGGPGGRLREISVGLRAGLGR